MTRITLASVAVAACVALPARPAPAQPQPAEPVPPVSASAQRIYRDAHTQLVQVRTLVKGQTTQSSVGSGFIVSDRGHILTNYHVVSEAALQPERYVLIYTASDRSEGPLQILGVDAVHDLALVRPATPAALAGRRPLGFHPRDLPLQQGERIYSLGNPLDIGFAVIEGTYNGQVERSFYPTIFFAGSLNPGVSGGPTLDEQGRVVGVNVAARRDGEQVSFLVPAAFGEDLLARARDGAPMSKPAYPEITRQLLAHQATLSQRLLAQPWRKASHPRYVLPLPQEEFMRCWGGSSPPDTKSLRVVRTNCSMDTRLFVSDFLSTGFVSIRHEVYDGRHLGTLRFAHRFSASFKNEPFVGPGNKERTASTCHERYVDRGGLPLRAVLCVSAYKRLPGLYDVGLLVASVDGAQAGLLGRLDARGVSFENALRLSDHFLEGFAWTPKHADNR